MADNVKVGRPKKHDKAGSQGHVHCRVPRRMKAHWQDFVDNSDKYGSLTDLLVEVMNKKTKYSDTIVTGDDLDDL
jgi:hypothetical protein